MKTLLTLLLLLPGICTASYVNMPSSYIELTPSNSLTFRGTVTSASMASLASKLSKLDQERPAGAPIYLVLDSPGGSIGAGQDFIDYARTVPNVHTISIFAASMAAGIVEALPGRRYITSSGTIMFHRASGGLEGQIETGEMESRLKYFKEFILAMEIRNAYRLNMPLKLYKDAVKDELWLYSTGAVKAGAADKVLDIRCSKDLVNKKEKILMSFLFWIAEVTQSACPLLHEATASDPKAQADLVKYQSIYKTTEFQRLK